MATSSRKLLSARHLAIRVLRDLHRRQGFSNRILSEHLENNTHLSQRDRALTTTLVYGVLRHQIRLDHIIDQHAKAAHKLKGELRVIIRLGAFELLELKHPLRVVGSEMNKLAKRLDPRGQLRGMLTAILIQIEQHPETADTPMLDQLEKRWSLPRWLAGRWIKALGPQTALARAQAIASPPPIDLRIDLTKQHAETVLAQLQEQHPGIQIERDPDQPQCLRTRRGGDLFYGPLYEQGVISIQSLGSQQAAIELMPRAGERILDACAGMGTKTLHIAELMGYQGSILAVDSHEERMDSLQELFSEREHAPLVLQTLTHDLCVRAPELDDCPFDAILLDAPCTGLGNLARHPELRTRARYEDIALCARLQEQLLDACVPRLAPGGRLLYAVCSLEAEEGPLQVKRALEKHDLLCEHEAIWSPEADGCDGFYLARLRVK